MRQAAIAAAAAGTAAAAAAAVVSLMLVTPARAAYGGPISNETTTTYWAYAGRPGSVRRRPSLRAPAFDQLRMWTETGYPEVYVVLSEWVDPHETWFKVRLPDRPNGRTGWVREQELSALHVVHTHLVVDESRLRMSLFRRGHRIFSAPIGIGKPSTPTPKGNFWVTEKFVAQGGVYGPYAFGTSDNSVLTDWPGGGVIGIHGTDQPSLVPGRPSHGCIRLHNADVTRLWPLLPIGTPLTIR
jgi:hypothetical protein